MTLGGLGSVLQEQRAVLKTKKNEEQLGRDRRKGKRKEGKVKGSR